MAASFDPDRLPSLQDTIRRHGLLASRRLGQHFLLDRRILERIAAAAGDLAGRTVIEVGPGPGGLTRALLARGAERLVAIERDPRCVPALQELAAAAEGRLDLVQADALAVDEAQLAPPPFVLVANLPYNVATPLLLKWLARIELFSGMTLMFQREVARRLLAAPGSRAYGRLSVMTRWLTLPRRLFDLPPQVFVPAPRVASTLVQLEPRRAPLAPADRRALERVTAAAFGQRRKMLRSSLRSLVPDPLGLLDQAGIAPELRAEALDVEAFCRLARAYEKAVLEGG